MWDDSKYIAFDFETSGTLPEYALQPWRVAQGKAWATSLATVRKIPDNLVIDGGLLVGQTYAQIQATIRSFLNYAVDHGLTVVGWNTAFDISWCIAYGCEDLVDKLKWLDGMLLWKHLTVEPEYEMTRGKKKSYRLKLAVTEFLPQFAGYEEDIDFHATDATSLLKLQAYNERDTMFTLRLARQFYNELYTSSPQRLRAALIEADCLPMVAKANLSGMLVDTEAASALGDRLVHVADDMLTRLAPYGVTEKVVRSPKQLSKLLFEDWGLPVLKQNTSKLTGNTTDSTDKEVLHELAFIDPRAAQIRAYREALGNKTKFVDAPLQSVAYNEDGKTRPAAIVFAAYSGRMSYASKQGKNKDERQTGFALHQEKRGKDFRSIIVAPPGYTLMEFDAAGQEFRWMAIAAEDATMLALCLPGEDPHSYMGAQVNTRDYRELISDVRAGVKEAKDARQLGKVANLSLQYRTSAKKLRVVARVQYNIPMGLPEAEAIHRTYQQSYRNVPLFWRRQIELTKRLGYVETFAGRRVQVAGNWRGPQGWSMESTSINYRIQGCLQAGVRVRTDAGEIPIQELVGATFQVWTGHKWASATAVNRGACQLAEVHLDTGEIIRCDTRHKLKTDDRTWLEFNQITPGVRIALPRLRELLQPSAEITWPFVLGYWLGDGWMGETRRGSKGFRRGTQFYGGREKLPTLQRMQRFFAEQGHTTYLRANARGVWSVSSYRKGLLQEMQCRGVPLGSRARTKRVPETVWRMPEQERRDFWAGVEASDGAKGKGQEGNVHTPNLSLVQDLQKLLSSIGGASWVVPTKNAWLLRVLRHDGGVYPKDVLLRDLGGFVPPCRMGDCASIVDRRAATGKQAVTQRVAERIYDRWLPQHEVYRYSTVKDVRVLGRAEDTFTLSVDDPLHQFVADGVVHKNTGADQKYLALSVLRPYITRIGAVFAWELHDGVYLYVPDAMVERAAVEIPYLLANLPYRKAWGFTPPIPLPWDCKFGPSWGMLKEWDNG